MSFFDVLLSRRNLENCPLPLWKLKVTDEEFQELRKILEARTHIINLEDPFRSHRREATLFFAEYWRRLYSNGRQNIQAVYDALNSTRNVDWQNEFYEAACRGAEILNIERYRGNRDEIFYDMLYQGGLPMKPITSNKRNAQWDRFTRGLINKRIDFEELSRQLGTIAAQSSSIQEFCNQIIKAIDLNKYEDMPFYCQDENNIWFLHLKELANEEEFIRRSLHQFSLSWLFDIDFIENKVNIQYYIKGNQHLTERFLEDQGLINTHFFSVQVRENGKAKDTFDYLHGFCRYAIKSKHPYKENDLISIYLHNNENPFLSEFLDMKIPHLLYLNNNDFYELGNKLGERDSVIVIPDDCEIINAQRYSIDTISWGKINFRIIKIDSNFNDEIRIQNSDGIITFKASAPLYWTELRTPPIFCSEIDEPIYDARTCRFSLFNDVQEDAMQFAHNVEYRNKWQRDWSDTPSFGEIYARAIDNDNNFVTPTRFINIGSRQDLNIEIKQADQDSCTIGVNWKHGETRSNEGEIINNTDWKFIKEKCKNPNRISFIFTPTENPNNEFSLSLKAPFRDFSISDIFSNHIKNGSCIPYSDIDRFQYHLVGQNLTYRYGNVRRSLRWRNDRLVITENDRTIRQISFEGNLLVLFDSREELNSILDKTGKNIISASIDVTFTKENGETFDLHIKEFPYLVRQNNNVIKITDNQNNDINYNGAIKILDIEHPENEAKTIFQTENREYIIPQEIYNWDKPLLIGRTRGRIRPTLINIDDDIRSQSRLNAIDSINNDLSQSDINSPIWGKIILWFYKAIKEDIPASSILELACTAKNTNNLFFLTFILYLKNKNEDMELVKEQLMAFSKDLAFQWYWLQPRIQDIENLLQDFIPDANCDIIKKYYILWALNKEEDDRAKYLIALNNNEIYSEYVPDCLLETISEYKIWIQELFKNSLTETYNNLRYEEKELQEIIANNIINDHRERYRVEDNLELYVEFNQEELSEETLNFFNQYSEDNVTPNEQWLLTRVNAITSHFSCNIDLFNQSEEIRRSIIFCCKSSNLYFLRTLNNNLNF